MSKLKIALKDQLKLGVFRNASPSPSPFNKGGLEAKLERLKGYKGYFSDFHCPVRKSARRPIIRHPIMKKEFFCPACGQFIDPKLVQTKNGELKIFVPFGNL